MDKFVLDIWNDKYKWLRRINRSTDVTLISDAQRVFTNKNTDQYIYFKRFSKKFKKSNSLLIDGTTENLNKLLLSKKTFKELFQTDVDIIQNKQQFIDDIHEKNKKYGFHKLNKKELEDKIDSNGYIGHSSFDLYDGLDELYKSTYNRIFNRDELYTLEMFLHDYDNIDYDGDLEIFKYLENLFNKKVYKLGDCCKRFVKEYDTYSELSKNQYFMQITHFGDDKNVISREDNEYNCTISFWVFDDRIIYQEESGIDTW